MTVARTKDAKIPSEEASIPVPMQIARKPKPFWFEEGIMVGVLGNAIGVVVS